MAVPTHAPPGFPSTRASGATRLRLEDFRPLALARMAKERTALYLALRDELAIRRALAIGVCAADAPDSLIRERVALLKKSATTAEGAAEIQGVLDAWLVAVEAITRVSPLDLPPSAA